MSEKILLQSMEPHSLGDFELKNKEYMQYLYYPFIIPGNRIATLEKRLHCFWPMIDAALGHYLLNFDKHFQSEDFYGYLTVKQTFVPVDIHQNRPGWHSDGFGTRDVQYIWYDKFPTEFMIGNFEVSADDVLSMLEMEAFGDRIAWESTGDVPGNTGYLYRPPAKEIYCIDHNHIHRTTAATESGSRAFVKITFSDHQYAQQGNSKNYELNYDWNEAPRKAFRNQPHQK